jgi:hypothetical protein
MAFLIIKRKKNICPEGREAMPLMKYTILIIPASLPMKLIASPPKAPLDLLKLHRNFDKLAGQS